MRAALLFLVACEQVDAVEPEIEPELWRVQYPGAALASICTFDGPGDCEALRADCECDVRCWPTEPLRHCAPPKVTP